MSPPCTPLKWDQVVEYAFLADFNLLLDCWQDVWEQPWAKPAARLAMDCYFKMERAQKEIQWLNIKIKHVVMHMCNEEDFLLAKEADIRNKDAVLTFQIQCYHEEHTQFYEVHHQHFRKLAQNPHFTGSIVLGTPLDKSLLQGSGTAMDIDELPAVPTPMDDEESDEEENGEDTEKEVVDALEVFTINSK